MHYLEELARRQKRGEAVGVYACCSANGFVLKAALKKAKASGEPVLIEATANQVNQFGGYTGMTPEDFYRRVTFLAEAMDVDASLVMLGGDHLGPLTWAHLPETQAMEHAKRLVEAYVLAGFSKIHIDTSMRLADDDGNAPLPDEVIARRGAALCDAAERAHAQRKERVPDAQPPVYVIGSEVPIPGGAQRAEQSVSVTRPEACVGTIEAFQNAFARLGLSRAWTRVVGVVAQPGVEFGDADVFDYDRRAARALMECMRDRPMVLEGHSTDYQTRIALRQMVEDGVAILKVGPALTFALREALLALEAIERRLMNGAGIWMSDFERVLERAMLENPGYWLKHYHGSGAGQAFKRLFSYSDRARYYLPDERVEASVARLISNLSGAAIPAALLSQYLPRQYARVREGLIANEPEALIIDRIGDRIDDYLFATTPSGRSGKD